MHRRAEGTGARHSGYKGLSEEELADPVFFTRFWLPGNVARQEDRMQQHEDRVSLMKG